MADLQREPFFKALTEGNPVLTRQWYKSASEDKDPHVSS